MAAERLLRLLLRVLLAPLRAEHLESTRLAAIDAVEPGRAVARLLSRNGDRLRAGEVDAGIVSSIEYLRIPDLRIVPGLCIASPQRVRSVVILSKVPPEQIKSLALDTSSRTSVVLAQLLLRERYGYDGVVCTDWGLITDAQLPDAIWPARAWGVEHLSRAERVRKALEAGVDQFGGDSCPELVVELVDTGRLAMARLDESVRRATASSAAAASAQAAPNVARPRLTSAS